MFSVITVHAQADEILEGFSLVQNGNSIIANFSIQGGASCSGVTLERRVAGDSEHSIAGQILGVCGGSEFTEHYNLEDSSPILGQKNFYRLRLGNTGVSKDISITPIELINEYNIYPQPSGEEIFVKFDNPNNEEVSLTIYDASGKLKSEASGYTEDIIYINGSNLESGLYIFQLIFTTDKIITGKFIRS